MTKILLDTDIGTDIDDAVCLAYLLAHPECELMGITTVTGEAVSRAMLASAICRFAGKNIPIFPGADQPLLVPQKQTAAAQARALGTWDHQKTFPRGEAIEFLRSTIRSHPGEIVLLTIAPLTNIGLLFATDPEIPSLLKGLVMMCGLFKGPIPGYGPLEWNAIGDPHASAIVYRSRVPLHRSVGLDVTSRVVLSANEFRRKFRRHLFGPVPEFAEIWFKDWSRSTFHDPLAAATIFDSSLCNFEGGTVDIELLDPQSQGMTRWHPDGREVPHEVAIDVDPDRFFQHYFSFFP